MSQLGGWPGGLADHRRPSPRTKPAKLAQRPALRALVEAKLALCWSPEQIAGRLRRRFPGDASIQISHEAIHLSLHDPRRRQVMPYGVSSALEPGPVSGACGGSTAAGDAQKIELSLVAATGRCRVGDHAQVRARNDQDVAVEQDVADLRMPDRLAVTGVLSGGCLRGPVMGKGGGSCPQFLHETIELSICGVAGDGALEVGDDRRLDGVLSALGLYGIQRGASGAVAEKGAREVALGGRNHGGVAVQCAPHGVPPHQGPVSGEYPDRDVAQARGHPLNAGGHVGADRAVLRW